VTSVAYSRSFNNGVVLAISKSVKKIDPRKNNFVKKLYPKYCVLNPLSSNENSVSLIFIATNISGLR